MQDLLAAVDAFVGLDVLVIGEAFLDGWLSGPSHRLSREAPVPIVDVAERVHAPGAAGNAAANLVALGARVHLVSVVGDDPDGALLRAALGDRGVSDDDVLVEPGRRTIAKRRVLAGGQMLVRYDEGHSTDIDAGTQRRLLDRVEPLLRRCDVVVVCDYAGGVLTERVLDRLAALTAAGPPRLVVDARDPARWARVRPLAVTPNAAEAAALLPAPEAAALIPAPEPARPHPDRAAAVEAAADRLLDAAGAQVAAVTLDTDGAVLLERERPAYRVFTEPVSHTQAAGAGDSFAATFALALGCGLDGPRAVELGSAAAGVVVQRPGTSVCSAADLRAAVARSSRALLDWAALAECVRTHRALGRRVVFTNGCFDVLHRGHVTYLNRAKQLGGVLVVGLNSDASVARLKGPDRPVNPVEDRAAVLAALSCVDHLVVFDGDTPADVLEAIRPDVYVKGGDYTPAMLPEAPLVERLGGEVRILDYLEDRSTSGLIARIRGAFPSR